MHDIDRAMFEADRDQEYELELENDQSGETGETEFEFEFESDETEMDELQIASELLEAHSEEELDQFIGDLVRKATKAATGFAKSSAGRAVGGLLKNAARRVLPHVGRAVGDFVAPGVGGKFGQRAGAWLGGRFELEGLSSEDQEFETARAFVRFANETAKRAAAAPSNMPPAQVARSAAVSAARRSLPGLTPLLQKAQPRSDQAGVTPGRSTGRWVRRGNRIILLGL